MIQKELDEITKEDLQLLITNEVQESKTIEYKRDLDITSGDKKKEFLADVSAFANASGGDLIFGISENKETGLPLELIGVNVLNNDEEIRRIENLIRDGISPRLPAVYVKAIEIDRDKQAIIIRVKKSWISPHRVVHGGHDKFYTRNSKEKYPLDVGELKNAFIMSETNIDRIKRFREDRISKLYANETPINFDLQPKIVLHLVPINAFSLNLSYDLKDIKVLSKNLFPIYSGGWNYRINFDGYLIYATGSKSSDSYTQLYKTGIIEAVNCQLLSMDKIIPSIAYEFEIIKSLSNYMWYMKSLNIDLPVIVFLSLIDVKGYTMAVDPMSYFLSSTYPIDREILITPEVLINSYDENPYKLIKPCFDTVWNACGWEQSLNYDKEGNWIAKY